MVVKSLCFALGGRGWPLRGRLFPIVAGWAIVLAAPAGGAVRIKDITSVEGVRENQLIGYGIVGGLKGTGDDQGTRFTIQSLTSFMRQHSIQIDPRAVDVENVAAVVVTATLPPFARQGSKIDVVVSSIGDAEDLHGGTLFATPLRPVGASPSAPGSIYAIAQGPISTGGFAAGGARASVVKNHPTAAVIPNGAIVEQEAPTSFATKPEVLLLLRNPDFTTASRIEGIINNTFGQDAAKARDAATVAVRMPTGGADARVNFLSRVESLEVSPDAPARVVYNERTGTIVMGANVRISTAIITHGNLIVKQQARKETLVREAILPSGAQTVTEAEVTAARTGVEEEPSKLQVVEEGVTVGEVADALNTLGVTARDIIAILQALKEVGALQAELVAM